MKHLLIITGLLFGCTAFSQGPCSNAKIEGPIVPKPTDAIVASASCSQLVLQWQGSSEQTYIASAMFKDLSDAAKMDTVAATNTTCGNDGTCTATIPVQAGTAVSWSVQGSQVIDGRTFYSYALRSSQDYTIPKCSERIAQNSNRNKESAALAINNSSVKMFPNPVHSILTLDLTKLANTSAGNSPTKATSIRVFDVNGRTVITKNAAVGNIQVNVSKLVNGAYFIEADDTQGTVLYYAKFIKN